jgi:hypothetical protein
VVLHVKNGEVEHNLLPFGDLDDPAALATVAVVVGPTGGVQDAGRGKVVTTAN